MRKFSSFPTHVLALTLTASTFGLVAPAAAVAAPVSNAAVADGILKLHNKARVNNDLGKLRINKCVQSFAQKQARKQARTKTMAHQSLGPILQACNLSSVGENVAVGYSGAKSVHTAWMNSSGHRANILGRSYRLVGVGVAKDENGRRYYATVFGSR